jgi:hypothetical protein
MAGYSFFDSSSDLSVTIPGEAEPTKKLTKLLIIHNMKPHGLEKRPQIVFVIIAKAYLK